MKENFKFIVSWILIIFVLGLGFYWYEWRPSLIVKQCHNEATEKAIRLFKSKAELKANEQNVAYQDAADKNMFSKDDYQFKYDQCIEKNGLR